MGFERRRAHGRPPAWGLVAITALLALAPSAARAKNTRNTDAASPAARADWLAKNAEERLAENTVDGRHAAIAALETAIRLAPGRADLYFALGDAQDRSRYDSMARASYHRAIALAPDQPEAYAALGASWKREYLKYLDGGGLDSARAMFDKVVALRPYSCDAWLDLVPVRYEFGDLDGAADAAERAHAARPGRADAMVAAAYLAWRRGEPERADSLFREAIPRMTPDRRVLYDNVAAVADEDEAARIASLAGPARDAAIDAYWARLDPDPTTPENEARLEYWSRVTHAILLFRDRLRPTLDARADVYIRYGPPTNVAYNPLGTQLYFKPKIVDPVAARSGGRSKSWQEYPLNAVVWAYPELGMRILLQDRMLDDTYDYPFEREAIPGMTPDPAALAARGDLIETGDGHAVFPALPPRAQRLDVRGIVARFVGTGGPRLLAQVDAPGGPADTLRARWVVQDTSGREIASGTAAFGTSGCDPEARRVAELATNLPPGDYTVVVSARDTHRRRGLFRAPAHVAAPHAGLALSDLVLTCGTAGALAGGSAIRLDANLDHRVAEGAPLAAYFEIYGLTPGDGGAARFEYEYQIQALQAPRNWMERTFGIDSPKNVVTVQSEEMQQSPMRRQFLNMPVARLAPGDYRLKVRVRDLVTDRAVTVETEFSTLPDETGLLPIRGGSR